MLSLFAMGLIIGFSVAAPVGPIGMLCINRTLHQGRMAGFATGLGAALADMLYGGIAGFGLVSVSTFLLQYQYTIRMVGGCFLVYLAFKTFFSKSVIKEVEEPTHTILKDMTTTFFLTLTNPATIISFIAIYSSLGIIDRNIHYIGALVLISGVLIGSLIWWMILSVSVHAIRHKLSDKLKQRINIFSGLVLLIFGMVAVVGANAQVK